MKPIFLILAGLLVSQCGMAQNFPPIDIQYNRAGLTQISIVTNHLTYITHSLKTNLTALRQDLSSYDRHESEATLDAQDRKQILDWIRTNDFFRIARPYPPGNPNSYGAAFQSTLEISLSGVRHQASWDGTSDCPEITKAIEQLESICTEITQKRNKSVEPAGGAYVSSAAGDPSAHP